MKLNKIASAVSISLAALALTACGGSSKSNTTPVVNSTPPTTTNPSTPSASDLAANKAAIVAIVTALGWTPEQVEKFAEANKAHKVDSPEFAKALAEEKKKLENTNTATNPTSPVITGSNPFIDRIDVRKEETVSTKHYSRFTDSTFDRIANKAQQGSSGDSTDLTVTNKYLSNFVIGSEADANGDRFAIDSMGEDVTSIDSSIDSGRDTNPKNVRKENREQTSYRNRATARSNGVSSEYEYTVMRRGDRKWDLTGTNAAKDANVHVTAEEVTSTVASTVSKDAKKVVTDIRTIQEENGYGLYATDHGNNIKVVNGGPNESTEILAYYARNNSFDDKGTTGLVGYADGSLKFGREENVYVIKDGKTTLDKAFLNRIGNRKEAPTDNLNIVTANSLTTRVFGKNYRDYEADDESPQVTTNSYTAELDAEKKKLVAGVNTVKLHDVQYGRLTSNIDTLVKTPDTNKKIHLIYRQFDNHGNLASVDTYFYRGTNETSIDNMKKVVENAKGGKINYYGHAVTYGIGPFAGAAESNKLPTAYSDEKGKTLGNFVEATFDTKTSTLEGSIYNLVTKGELGVASGYDVQKLVTFTGNVVGNTVADGVSVKRGAKPETGSFIASFYGEKAQELGGNVSSVTKESGFGETKWGAVFGATQGLSGGNYSTGQATP